MRPWEWDWAAIAALVAAGVALLAALLSFYSIRLNLERQDLSERRQLKDALLREFRLTAARLNSLFLEETLSNDQSSELFEAFSNLSLLADRQNPHTESMLVHAAACVLTLNGAGNVKDPKPGNDQFEFLEACQRYIVEEWQKLTTEK